MSFRIRILLGLVCAITILGASLSISPHVGALPDSDYTKTYFDANNNYLGERDLYCDGSHFSEGLGTGAYMNLNVEKCAGGSSISGTLTCFVCYPPDWGCGPRTC